MVAQLVENFVHFKRRQNCLDQHGRANTSLRNTQIVLRKNKNIVPQPRFQMTFYFRQIKIRGGAGGEEEFGIMEKVQSEVEKGAGQGSAVDKYMPLFKMPATRSDEQHGSALIQLILLFR